MIIYRSSVRGGSHLRPRRSDAAVTDFREELKQGLPHARTEVRHEHKVAMRRLVEGEEPPKRSIATRTSCFFCTARSRQ